ncbi:ras-associated and pleckstrin homology domains-containing protein 1-like [Montipora capricornis]|uniref:ras-associated and pleckstrin homology domains-containing protein 1-like n=1 Tax=Montipora capricornis TaxID=246305 RepID=UPI0035F1CA5F
MKTALAFLHLLTLLFTFGNGLALKHKSSHGGRKSIVVQNPVLRSAWECHPGCKKFCLSSCKRSCCAPGAPNYSPDMFPQLVNYQASLPPPPPPPPACPTGCPSTCYPNCDAGCCFPVSQQPAYPQYSPYSTAYDPCAVQSCSTACAPQCKPDCCRSQALNLSIRPVYLGSNASPAAVKKVVSASTKQKPPSPPPPPPPKKKQVSFIKKPKTGVICVPQCQRLCKPVCIFKCCLPTYKFHDSHPEPKKSPKLHHVRPVAAPQRAPVPKLISQPKPTDARVPDVPQLPYADVQQSPYADQYQYANQAAVSPYMAQQQPESLMPQQPFPYGSVPANPTASSADYQRASSPGLAPLTCPEPSCSDACAPICSRSCCARMSPQITRPWDKRNAKQYAV